MLWKPGSTRREASGAIDRGDHESIVIRETIGQLALERRWSEVWEIADSMGREVSIPIDRRNKVFVDVGTAGRVNLNPPEDRRYHSDYGFTPILGMPIGRVLIGTH